MKRALFVLAFILSFSPLLMAQWIFVGPVGISEEWTTYNKIDIDAKTGFPVIVYTENNKAVCLKYDGTKWDSVGDSTFKNFPVGYITDFKIDKKNNYNLLFTNDSNYKSSCIRFDGDTWEYVGSQYITEDKGVHRALGIDTSGIVYFVLEHDPHQIFKENGDTWKKLSSEGLGSGGLAFPKLLFDSDNIPILSYNGRCSKFVDNKWIPVGNTNISATNVFADFPNLHITGDNDYYIAFRDTKARCFKLNKTSNIWELVGKASSELEKLEFVEDIVSDSESNIYLVGEYLEGANYNLHCYSFKGNKWQLVGNEPVSDFDAGYLSLAFSEIKQKLYCLYNDFGTSKATVKEYSITTGIHSEKQVGKLNIYPNPSVGEFFIEVPGEKFSMEIYSINGSQIFNCKNNFSKVKIRESFLKRGIYLVKIVTENNYLLYKKLVII